MEALGKLFGSTARVKLLRLFLFNNDASYSVGDTADRTKLPRAVVRKELALLAKADIVRKRGKGYQANTKFKYYEPLIVFLRSTTSIKDSDVIDLMKRAGTPRVIVLSGIFTGSLEPKIDVLVVGDRLEERRVKAAIHAIEAELGRELRYAAFATPDFRYRLGVYDRLIRDVMDYPHRTILDRLGL